MQIAGYEFMCLFIYFIYILIIKRDIKQTFFFVYITNDLRDCSRISRSRRRFGEVANLVPWPANDGRGRTMKKPGPETAAN